MTALPHEGANAPGGNIWFTGNRNLNSCDALNYEPGCTCANGSTLINYETLQNLQSHDWLVQHDSNINAGELHQQQLQNLWAPLVKAGAKAAATAAGKWGASQNSARKKLDLQNLVALKPGCYMDFLG